MFYSTSDQAVRPSPTKEIVLYFFRYLHRPPFRWQKFLANQQFKLTKHTLRATWNTSYFACKRRIRNHRRTATKMQMHVIITRRASSENLLPLFLGLSSTRHEESLLVRKTAKGRVGLKKKEEEGERRRRSRRNKRDKRRIRRWRVEKGSRRNNKAHLHAKEYSFGGGCCRGWKKELAATLTDPRLIPSSSRPSRITRRTHYLLYLPSLIGWLNSRVIAVENYPDVFLL